MYQHTHTQFAHMTARRVSTLTVFLFQRMEARLAQLAAAQEAFKKARNEWAAQVRADAEGIPRGGIP